MSVLLGAVSSADLLFIDITGKQSWDLYGDASNTVITNNIGANSHVTGIGYDVSLSTVGNSWLSEAAISFEDSTTAVGVWLTPGVGDDMTGSANYSSGGIVDLVGLGLDFTVGGDGILRSEFFEHFDDVSDSVDGNWTQGVLTVEYTPVPEPGTMIALGLGASALLARKRRKA